MRRSLVLPMAVVVVGGLAFTATAGDVARRSPLHDLGRPARVFAARLAVETEHRPCALLVPDTAGTVPRERCGSRGDVPASAAALASAGESTDPDSLRASALAAVIWWDATEASMNAAVERLERARRLSASPVPLLVDLSGVHLARAERTQSPRDLMQGLQYAREALEREPRNAPALFNAALALTRIPMDEQAVIAWDDYLAVDSTSPWADEARRRKEEVPRPVSPTPPGFGAGAGEAEEFARKHPLEARLQGWDDLLGQWGSALQAGDRARADSALVLAEMLGAALERRPRGDATLADAVRAIRAAAPDPAATRALARAHREYAAGQEFYNLGNHDAARAAFARVSAARPPSPTLVQWAEVFRGASLAYSGKFDDAHAVFRILFPRMDTIRHPALVARMRWVWGTMHLRGGEYDEASAHYRAAERAFERLGETEYLGAVINLAGEAAYVQGDSRTAYESMHRALLILRNHRSSLWLHSALVQLAHCTTVDEMPLAAEVILDEDVSVARHVVDAPHPPAEALLTRARVRARTGRLDLAARDLDSAELLVPPREAKASHDWLKNVSRFSRAVVTPDADPARSVAALDSAVKHFGKNVVWLIPALVQRANARLASGDLDGATVDLDSATARIRRLSEGLPEASIRAAMIEEARGSFDKLVVLHLRGGRTAEALRALERGRVSFAPAAELRTPAGGAPLAAPRGHVAVEYALIGDTLLTWTVRGPEIRILRRSVSRAELLRAVERVGYALETGRAASARTDLERLYDELIRPLDGRLGPPETPLVILADGELSGVPFPALYDAERKRYLVQDRPIRFAATLADASRPPLPADPNPRALLVADPDFDADANLMLDPLPGALDEAAALARLYRDPVRLAGAGATRAALAARAAGVDVIHYAGHAVSDDARPERSFLLLAGEGASGRLSADSLARMELGGVRLVVLSACRTLRSRQGRSGGFAGLSGALLAAGAGGVVGSPWEVHDRLAQPLMLAFHRAYIRTGDPARALREAQIFMLTSKDSTRSSPAAWAGFRYAGR